MSIVIIIVWEQVGFTGAPPTEEWGVFDGVEALLDVLMCVVVFEVDRVHGSVAKGDLNENDLESIVFEHGDQLKQDIKARVVDCERVIEPVDRRGADLLLRYCHAILDPLFNGFLCLDTIFRPRSSDEIVLHHSALSGISSPVRSHLLGFLTCVLDEHVYMFLIRR